MAKARLPGQISGEVIDMDFMAEYKHWLESGALSAEEHAELQPSWLLLQIIRKRSKAVSLRRCRSARPVCAVYWASASTA